jgi:hypothetical protein
LKIIVEHDFFDEIDYGTGKHDEDYFEYDENVRG